jgi:adenylate kinase family enzyme
MLTGGSDLAAVIVLAAPDEVLLDRAQRRGRVDDTATAITRRLANYRERTKPLRGYYGDLVTVIDGARDTGLVHEDIVRTIQTRITHA